MSVGKLLERLDKVRQERRGQWVACCPAHVDKSPSLAIGEADDGRVLVHCHSGCSALDVISAVGLQWADLFPETDRNHRSLMEHMRRKPTVDDYVVSFAEYEKKQKREFTSEDKKRYLEALKRGGKNNGFTTEVIAEILMGEADQILKEHGV